MSLREANGTSSSSAAPGSALRARGEAILSATRAELAVVGYRALSIETVAEKIGVNKTTIYRRWPTKKALVQAAIQSYTSDGLTAPNTGSLRGDLLATARAFVQRASSLEGQSLFRIIALETADPEIETIAMRTRERHDSMMGEVLNRALERGELTQALDRRVLSVALIGPLYLRTFMNNQRADEGFIASLVDLLLLGLLRAKAKAPASRRRKP